MNMKCYIYLFFVTSSPISPSSGCLLLVAFQQHVKHMSKVFSLFFFFLHCDLQEMILTQRPHEHVAVSESLVAITLASKSLNVYHLTILDY